MKTQLLLTALASCLIVACDPPPSPMIPASYITLNDSVYSNYAYVTGIPLLNTSGVMIAGEIEGSGVYQTGDTVRYHAQWAEARFNDIEFSSMPAGNVSLNGHLLSMNGYPGHNQYYLRQDMGVFWNLSNPHQWEVSGSTEVPAISKTVSGNFPQYTGPLVWSVNRNTNFTMTFSQADAPGADSAFVIIRSDGNALQSNMVSVNGGVATIPSTQLQWLAPQTIGQPGMNFGGVIHVVVLKYERQGYSQKNYAFVKLKEVTQSIDIQ